MKHYYRIGEISKLYHIGPDSLRYYEELGILKPHRGANNYRMYHIHDLWRLNVIRDLRELGFSMEAIKNYLDNRTLSGTEDLLRHELELIEERMRSLELLKSNIQERLATIQEAREQKTDVIEELQLKPRHCYMIHSSYRLDDEMEPLIKQLLNKSGQKTYIIGNNRTGSIIPLQSALHQDYQNYTDVFILDKEGDDVIPGGLYLAVRYKGMSSQNARYIPLLFSYAQSHGLRLKGNVLELLWSDIHQSNDVNEFITELQVLCVRA